MDNKNAWELARMIIGASKEAFSKDQLQEIFSGYNEPFDILNNYTFDECKAKIKDWEMSKQIYIGDVVTYSTDNTLGVILDVSDKDKDIYYVYTENGCVEEWGEFRIKKTGKDINPQKLLFEQLF